MTVTVRLDEETEAKMRRLIEQGGGSLSAFVRAAITEKLQREVAEASPSGKPAEQSPYELGKHLFGRYRSGLGDLAENHTKYFRETMRAKHRR